MNENPESLNALSEMIALSSYGNTKNLIITAVDLGGPIDPAAMILATKRTGTTYPQFASTLKEIRQSAKHRLVWERHPDLEVPTIVTELKSSDAGGLLENFLLHLSPRLDRNWNLFEEVPAEVHLVRVSENHYILAPVIHHAVADGGTASEFGRELLANYHEIITGERPHWACEPHPLSSTKKRMVEAKKASLRDYIQEAREAVTHAMEKPILLKGEGTPGDTRQFHVKRLLSEEDSLRIIGGSFKRGISPVDLFAACTNLAIDGWNGARDVPPGLLTTSVSVNMRGRFRGFEGGNTSGLIFFRSAPEDRRDLRTYARSIAVRRIRHFRNQMDLTFFQNVSRMTGVLNLFPFKARQRAVHFLMNTHQFSAAVTFLGVIWPVFKNGKLSMESSPTEMGGISIDEVHGIGYKLLSNTRILLIAYIFRNRLNLMLAASASLFTREEAESFTDLILANLMQNALEAEAGEGQTRPAVGNGMA
ncbi:MAG: hypothetical protein HY912_22060 [Desulfomonile tiedjei]|uniref:Condensation domain-containing protein n=1 Tax=Desulfomonile tiedjei TaxID=2358 RepID=A0A9D6V5D9_9BACT|nr:hypothetical protein [Desulfomonile tiedjei]